MAWLARAACLVLPLALGCGEEVRQLQWEVDFASGEDRAAATALSARILAEGCGGSTVVWRGEIRLSPGAAAPMSPPRLAPGTYGFVVEARDTSCTRIARGCEPLRLPQAADSTVRVELATDRAPSPECDVA